MQPVRPITAPLEHHASVVYGLRERTPNASGTVVAKNFHALAWQSGHAQSLPLQLAPDFIAGATRGLSMCRPVSRFAAHAFSLTASQRPASGNRPQTA